MSLVPQARVFPPKRGASASQLIKVITRHLTSPAIHVHGYLFMKGNLFATMVVVGDGLFYLDGLQSL